MKSLAKKHKSKKGFTLVECVIAIGVFAIMAAIVMQILAISIAKYRNNHKIDKNIDEQIQALAEYNSTVSVRETKDMTISFLTGADEAAGSINVSGVQISKADAGDEANALQLNKIVAEVDAETSSDEESSDSSESSDEVGTPLMSKYKLYGPEGIKIQVTGLEDTVSSIDNSHRLKIKYQVTNSSGQFGSNDVNALKIELPPSANSISIETPTNIEYRAVLGISTYRFQKTAGSTISDTPFDIIFEFTLSETAYDKEYVSFNDYFGFSSGSTITDTPSNPGIYDQYAGATT